MKLLSYACYIKRWLPSCISWRRDADFVEYGSVSWASYSFWMVPGTHD